MGIGFEEYAVEQMRLYKTSVKIEEGPKSPKERRKIAEERKAQGQVDREREEKEAISFGQFFKDTYLGEAAHDKKPSTVRREKGLVSDWIIPVIGTIPLRQVAPFHVEKIKKRMADVGQSPRSIEYAFACTHQVFNAAKPHRLYEGDPPTKAVKKPKVDNGRMRFLSREEADRLLSALKEKSIDVHDQTLLSLHCGLRFGEIASLTWQDVDLEKDTLTIRDAKAGRRYAFMTSQVTSTATCSGYISRWAAGSSC